MNFIVYMYSCSVSCAALLSASYSTATFPTLLAWRCAARKWIMTGETVKPCFSMNSAALAPSLGPRLLQKVMVDCTTPVTPNQPYEINADFANFVFETAGDFDFELRADGQLLAIRTLTITRVETGEP